MLVREHALLAKAVEAEVTDFLGKHADLKQFGAQMIRHRRAEPDLARRHHLCRDRSGLALRSWTSTAAIVGWASDREAHATDPDRIGSRPRSCRPICAALNQSRRCCRSFI
jgi:hypothetical protein